MFTDGHAVVQFSEFFSDLRSLARVDLALMKQQYWNDGPDDNDRERRRNAEFLVHSEVPWSLISGIGVINQRVADAVTALLPHGTVPTVQVRAHWYY